MYLLCVSVCEMWIVSVSLETVTNKNNMEHDKVPYLLKQTYLSNLEELYTYSLNGRPFKLIDENTSSYKAEIPCLIVPTLSGSIIWLRYESQIQQTMRLFNNYSDCILFLPFLGLCFTKLFL